MRIGKHRKIYFDRFSSWEDVQREYGMNLPEPDVVIAAYGNDGSYGGESMVLYRGGDSYYLVEGSHCSCYGLEDQWEPTNLGNLNHAIEYLQNRGDLKEGIYWGHSWASKALHELTLRACARLI